MNGRVLQFLPFFASRDAVGESAMVLHHAALSAGMQSLIVTPNRQRSHPSHVVTPDHIVPSIGPNDLAVYHLSIGSPLAALVASLPCKRIVLYHNITPPEDYDAVNARVAYWARRGLGDLEFLAPLVDQCIGFSAFTCADLIKAGCPAVTQMPLPIRLERLGSGPSRPPSTPAILFVGRIAPNKRVERVLQTARIATDLLEQPVRCRIIGRSADNDFYQRMLVDYAAKLGLESSVEWTPGLSDLRLGEAYRSATVYLSMSTHEGVGAPLLEAMSQNLPVVARKGGAIEETVGEGGIILDTGSPLEAAEAVAKLVGDDGFASALRESGRTRVERYRQQMDDAPWAAIFHLHTEGQQDCGSMGRSGTASSIGGGSSRVL